MPSARSNVLIVEGTDDRYFINQILTANGYRKSRNAGDGKFAVQREADGADITIVHSGGFDSIPRTLKDLFQPDSLGAIAIVADMDLHLDGRWSSLKGMLSAYQYSGLPDVLPSDGLVQSPAHNPVLGVWLMPDNLSEGMAESFAVSLVLDGDATLAHATSTVTELPITAKRFATRHNDKALLHTWLAWQEEPGCQTGAAILRKLLDVSRPPAVRFVAWIERWLEAGTTRPTPT